MSSIILREEYITLGQALKASGVAQTGGEAKMLLAQNDVHVNGEVDNRRGRKLRAGDVITIGGMEPIRILASPE